MILISVMILLPLIFGLVLMTTDHVDYLLHYFVALGIAIFGFLLTNKSIPAFKEVMKKAGIFAKDSNHQDIEGDEEKYFYPLLLFY